jgi:hypothetical protein
VLVPIIIAVVCFAAGVIASSRWLPDLEAGTLGTITFFVVCGLCGAVVAIVGDYIYLIVRDLEQSGRLEILNPIAGLLAAMLRDGGTVAGLALIAYLLAPKPPRETAPPAGEATGPPDLVST